MLRDRLSREEERRKRNTVRALLELNAARAEAEHAKEARKKSRTQMELERRCNLYGYQAKGLAPSPKHGGGAVGSPDAAGDAADARAEPVVQHPSSWRVGYLNSPGPAGSWTMLGGDGDDAHLQGLPPDEVESWRPRVTGNPATWPDMTHASAAADAARAASANVGLRGHTSEATLWRPAWAPTKTMSWKRGPLLGAMSLSCDRPLTAPVVSRPRGSRECDCPCGFAPRAGADDAMAASPPPPSPGEASPVSRSPSPALHRGLSPPPPTPMRSPVRGGIVGGVFARSLPRSAAAGLLGQAKGDTTAADTGADTAAAVSEAGNGPIPPPGLDIGGKRYMGMTLSSRVGDTSWRAKLVAGGLGVSLGSGALVMTHVTKTSPAQLGKFAEKTHASSRKELLVRGPGTCSRFASKQAAHDEKASLAKHGAMTVIVAGAPRERSTARQKVLASGSAVRYSGVLRQNEVLDKLRERDAEEEKRRRMRRAAVTWFTRHRLFPRLDFERVLGIAKDRVAAAASREGLAGSHADWEEGEDDSVVKQKEKERKEKEKKEGKAPRLHLASGLRRPVVVTRAQFVRVMGAVNFDTKEDQRGLNRMFSSYDVYSRDRMDIAHFCVVFEQYQQVFARVQLGLQGNAELAAAFVGEGGHRVGVEHERFRLSQFYPDEVDS